MCEVDEFKKICTSYQAFVMTDRKGTCGCQGEGGGGRGMDWESEVGSGKLLHIGWTNNKVLLYSTGNYIQYPMINYNRKEY